MPRQTRGTTYPVKGGLGIRWQHDGTRDSNPGPFRNKTDAQRWFDEHVAPRLRHGGPTATITYNTFVDIYLERWGVDRMDRTVRTLKEWLAPSQKAFGRFTLDELQGAADDVARWRSRLPTEHQRYKATRAMKQVLAAGVRWGYVQRNPAKDFGSNPIPRSDEIRPFTRVELDAICEEIAPRDQAIVIFAAETGLRTNEWIASERRDVDRRNPAVAVARRASEGTITPYPKTGRRRVPLTPRALEAIDLVPPRLDSVLLFPAPEGGLMHLQNWRLRVWYPALEAAGIEQRGPYCLRHTFATEALASGVSIFRLARLMGTSSTMIDRTYGHLAHDSEEDVREMLSNRSARIVPTADGENPR